MPSSLVGTILALILCGLVVAAAWLVIRRPAVAIGVLVAGMAFHNFVIMVLLVLRTPALLIRAVQSWKEVLLVLLTALALVTLVRAYRRGDRLRLVPADWIAIAFFVLLVVYVLLPTDLLHGRANFLQRLVAFRIDALIPLLYFLGRVFATSSEEDLALDAWLIAGAAALVAVFGLYELWLVPTQRWLDWGVNLYSSWLGFVYTGPAGLPPNFFQTLPDGLLLRRMVSTYISPLGIAYTGILVWPLAAVLVSHRRANRVKALLAGLVVALALTGILFSLTRLAIFMLVVEGLILGVMLRTRLAWILAIAVGILAAAVLFLYPSFGPVVDPNLLPGFSHQHTVFSAGDPSLREHLRALAIDVRVAAENPLGTGLGGTIGRFVPAGSDSFGPGESAALGIFVDLGVLGGVLYSAFYGLGLRAGWLAYRKAPRRWFLAGLPLVASAGGLALIPITLTSDVWADFSVSFLFWLAVGHSTTVAARPLLVAQEETTSAAVAVEPGRA